MPTYVYACTSCGEGLEAVQKFSDEPLTECPACGGRLRKVFSPVGVVFKGSGFYKTDSRSSSSKTSAGDSGAKSDTNAAADSAGTGKESSSKEPSKESKDSSSTTASTTSSSSSSGQVA